MVRRSILKLFLLLIFRTIKCVKHEVFCLSFFAIFYKLLSSDVIPDQSKWPANWKFVQANGHLCWTWIVCYLAVILKPKTLTKFLICGCFAILFPYIIRCTKHHYTLIIGNSIPWKWSFPYRTSACLLNRIRWTWKNETKIIVIVIIIIIIIIIIIKQWRWKLWHFLAIRYSTIFIILRNHEETLKPSGLPSMQCLVNWYS